ncbi:DNA polymerase III, delta subunit [Legionella longbeachae]|uniref:DNA polymerase III subunit delta n=2 Tax=Legionella oakridgensis TaxID=29423 RepID=A0A0W0X0B1_9GAMM|nr:DNA polymerase III, delta, subunit [Legionella oakridgensis RV-2-2007]KTD38012.1 DNA polymerase III, delta subunit [Legionella oakridgensis]STY20266.1 DNA polymerase III, delta subunit [Legionella longbeachae]
MLIKHQALATTLTHKLYAMNILIGHDPYLLNDAALQVKKTWLCQAETDEKTLNCNTTSDWTLLIEEANSYSLFAKQTLLNVYLDKKTIEKPGKEVLNHYLEHINPHCLIILRAPQIPIKQLQWLANHDNVLIVQAFPLTAAALQSWIASELKHRSIHHDSAIPALIHQYTQGNMLACAQIIEKLALIYEENNVLTSQHVIPHLTDQCDYQLYELADACLAAQIEKAVHLLRQACHNRQEPTLILWLITQEIRQMIQLLHKIKQSIPFTMACSQLNIWPQRARLYQAASTRFSLDKLYQLLHLSKQLDEQIKSNQNNQIWHGLEYLAILFCSSTN